MKLIGMIVLIMLSITFPLIKFYRRNNCTPKQSFISILSLSLLCFLIHAPLHEFCHFISGKLMGVDVLDYQFFSRLSFKNFQNASVRFSDRTPNQLFLVILY